MLRHHLRGALKFEAICTSSPPIADSCARPQRQIEAFLSSHQQLRYCSELSSDAPGSDHVQAMRYGLWSVVSIHIVIDCQ